VVDGLSLSAEWIIAAFAASVSYAVCVTLWLGGQFSKNRSMIFDQIKELRAYVDIQLKEFAKEILSKMEYHERHDDHRFGELKKEIDLRSSTLMNDIWTLKLANAARNPTDCREDKTSAQKKEHR